MSKILASRSIKEQHVPGDEGVFIFVIIDMLVFAALFSSYNFECLKDSGRFLQSQTYLSVNTRAFNTFVLLKGSWIIIAIRALENRRRFCLLFLALTILCGIIFGISEGLEYKAKITADITMITNDFFMTGSHFVDVVIDGIVLLVMF